MAATGVHIALLRGINVGGKNRLAMKDLAALFVAAGCTDVATYIQSGNVVFRATSAVARTIPDVIAAAIQERYSLVAPIVTRSAAELRAAIAANPFAREASVDTAALHLMFLADRPTAAAVKALPADRSPGDRFAVIGRDVFLCLPNGVARTKLSNAWFDAQLKTVSTGRNWKTVLALASMAGVAP
jgi:uncharacterized protein (DUF1697 family)